MLYFDMSRIARRLLTLSREYPRWKWDGLVLLIQVLLQVPRTFCAWYWYVKSPKG